MLGTLIAGRPAMSPDAESVNACTKITDSRNLSAVFANFLCRSSDSDWKRPTTITSFAAFNRSEISDTDWYCLDAGPTCDRMYLAMPSASRGPWYSCENSPDLKILSVGYPDTPYSEQMSLPPDSLVQSTFASGTGGSASFSDVAAFSYSGARRLQ